jgi:hypothetical protein
VSLRDVAATLADVVLPDSESSTFPGRSLARFWDAPESSAGAPEPVFSEIVDNENARSLQGTFPRLVIAEGYTYFLKDDGREELYDTSGDPDEARNLAADPAHAAILGRLRALLDAHE